MLQNRIRGHRLFVAPMIEIMDAQGDGNEKQNEKGHGAHHMLGDPSYDHAPACAGDVLHQHEEEGPEGDADGEEKRDEVGMEESRTIAHSQDGGTYTTQNGCSTCEDRQFWETAVGLEGDLFWG